MSLGACLRRASLPVLALAALGLAAVTARAGSKNLKYYPQDISGDELQANMKGLKAALGVQCNHCHVVIPRKQFDKDTPNKQITLSMLRMVDKINKDCFKWKDAPKATCYMCHRGQEKPELKPEKAEMNAKFEDLCKDPEQAAAVKNMKAMVETFNKKIFTWKNAPKATCWMCHHGEKEPKLKVPEE